MIKYIISIISIFFLYTFSNSQRFGIYPPPEIHVIKYIEISGHIMAIADVDEDSCRYLFLVNISKDFIPLSVVCPSGEISRLITDNDLKILMDRDTQDRKEQKSQDSAKIHRNSQNPSK